MSAATAKHATLLFAHGAGFCKQVWDPVIHRVQQSALLQAVPTDVVNFNLRYHGTERDESVAPKVVMLDAKTPRVEHPGNQAKHTTAEDVQLQVGKIRAREARHGLPRSSIIGVGHSMGACGMWTAEMARPGTFDGLILFEPIYGFHRPENKKLADFFVSVTLQRETRWNSRAEAIAHFCGLKSFAHWHRDALDGFLAGALVDDDGAGVTLACHPHIEASFYSGEALWLSDHELAQPQCSVSFQRGERSALFDPATFATFVNKFPHIYKMDDALPGRSHLMVMEDPDAVATRVVSELEQLPVFAEHVTETDSAPYDALALELYA